MPGVASHRYLAIAVCLIVVTASYASPTAASYSKGVLLCNDCSIEHNHGMTAPVCESANFIDSPNPYLTNIAGQILKAPADSSDLTASLSQSARSLPPLPGALLMGVTGFLCVSLIKDRKVWLAALAGLLWAGHASLASLPQMASQTTSQKHINKYLLPRSTPRIQDSDRKRSDLEGTYYIGLLYYLAGTPEMSILQKNESGQTVFCLGIPQFVSTPLQHLFAEAPRCLAREARQFTSYFFTFTFVNIVRGPPRLTLY